MYIKLHIAVLIILCILMIAGGVWAGHMKWDMIEKDGKKIQTYWHKKEPEKVVEPVKDKFSGKPWYCWIPGANLVGCS